MKRNTIVTEQGREAEGRGDRWLEKEGSCPRAQVDARPRCQSIRMIEAEGEGGLGEGGGPEPSRTVCVQGSQGAT